MLLKNLIVEFKRDCAILNQHTWLCKNRVLLAILQTITRHSAQIQKW